MVDALVHSQGVVLGRTYYPLELAYWDLTGGQAHFHINSPIGSATMRQSFPYARPDVFVITQGGTPYSEVLHFLKERSESLAHLLGRTPVFGYKGESYQPQVLRDAQLSSILNVERLGVPALRITNRACCLHPTPRSKCAVEALRQMLP